MKNAKIPATLILLLAMVSPNMAQTNPVINKKVAAQFDIMLMSMKKIDVTKPDEVRKTIPVPARDQIFDVTLATLNLQIESAKNEIATKRKQFIEPTSHNGHLIDNDLLPLLSGIPEPVASLPDAKKIMHVKDEENIYNMYIEKLKRLQERYIGEARKYSLTTQNAEQIKLVAEKNSAKTMQALNNNSLIQQAGGMEKLQQMTPAEREAWAKKMVEQVKNNPSAYSNNSYPRKAFTNKMMNDPNYAARFQHMNQAQQQEEYRMFLADNGFAATDLEKSEETNPAHNEATITIAISQRTTDILNHRKQLSDIAGSAQKKTDDYFVFINNSLNDQYRRVAESLPLTDHGEAGQISIG